VYRKVENYFDLMSEKAGSSLKNYYIIPKESPIKTVQNKHEK